MRFGLSVAVADCCGVRDGVGVRVCVAVWEGVGVRVSVGVGVALGMTKLATVAVGGRVGVNDASGSASPPVTSVGIGVTGA